MKMLQRNHTEKITNQGKFKMQGWEPQRGSASRCGASLLAEDVVYWHS